MCADVVLLWRVVRLWFSCRCSLLLLLLLPRLLALLLLQLLLPLLL